MKNSITINNPFLYIQGYIREREAHLHRRRPPAVHRVRAAVPRTAKGARGMPEEVNRVLIDRISNLLFCPIQTAVDNPANEAILAGENTRKEPGKSA